MHKLHVETFFEFRREFAQGWLRGFHIVVADSAHRLLLGISELADVAAYTRIVTRKLEIETRAFAAVARIAFELRVFGNGVREILERFVRNADRDRRRSFGCSYGDWCLRSALDTTRDEHRKGGA